MSLLGNDTTLKAMTKFNGVNYSIWQRRFYGYVGSLHDYAHTFVRLATRPYKEDQDALEARYKAPEGLLFDPAYDPAGLEERSDKVKAEAKAEAEANDAEHAWARKYTR